MSLTIKNLLMAMKEERKKNKTDEDEDFIYVQEVNNEWTKLFEIYFLSPTTRLAQTSNTTTSDDDLIFYVARKMQTDMQHSPHVEAFRHHDMKRRPKLGSSEYDWEETTNLNLVLHQFEYTVTTAVCIKTSSKHLQIVKRLSTRVYADPSRRDMNNKGIEEKIMYPNMYFIVDNFEDAFHEIVVNEGQMVCVELIARNPVLNDAKVLFLGSIKYEALKKVYDTRATTSARVAQRVTLGMYTKHRVEFVRMRGPNGKGHAEMAISKYRSVPSSRSSPRSSSTTSITPITPSSDETNDNNRHTLDNRSATPYVPPSTRQQQNASHATTPVVESDDIHQDLSDDTGGFLGRTLNQAMNWVRNSNLTADQSTLPLPLQTCLTYLTLPCNCIVKDILESNSAPILTPQQSN